MPVRYPPSDRVPPVSRGGRGVSRTRRIVSYEEPGTTFPRRLGRRFFSAPVIIPLTVLLVIVFGILIYYWTIFSGRIDTILRGEVFTRSAGIYAAPKQLRVGETLSQDELIAYLKRAGYVEKRAQADTARGRYSMDGGAVNIEPSQNSTVDGQPQFQRIR